MHKIYEDMTWLPSVMQDFSKKVASATNGENLRELAQYSLDDSQLNKLFKRFIYLQTTRVDLSPLIPLDIGLVSNSTTKLLIPALVATALRYGIALSVVDAGQNQIAQEAFSTNSIFEKQSLSSVLVAIDYRGLALLPALGNQEIAEKNVETCIAYITSIINSLHLRTNAHIILQNFALPADTPFGSYESQLAGTQTWTVARINKEINSLISNNVTLLDVAGLSQKVGILNWHDPTMWNIGKIPFSPTYNPIYAEYVSRILAATLGKSRRCLILDLDNTLWGGVIGDDGLAGILIGNGDPTGEAHLDVQRTAQELRSRGVVLAVSSKNEDQIARLPFQKHPDMLLRENHIAVFQANWSDKASNIKAIAETLNLGLQSMVFLDDNPAERMLVRKELPEVAVPELPTDPALFSRTLIAAGYFETLGFTAEDKQRATFYQGNAKRAQILDQSSDMETYLNSLKMEITFSPFDAIGRKRIVQLLSKSNQFNLTTIRYDEQQVEAFENNSCYFTRQIRLNDVFGDNGMISVVICKKYDAYWEVDTWLMSCRVLNRFVEFATLNEIVTEARKTEAVKIIGKFVQTDKNAIVKNHYAKLGFKKLITDSSEELWELELDKHTSQNLPFIYKYAL